LINAAFITIAFSVNNVLAQSQQWWRTNGNTPNSTDFLGTSNPSPLIVKTNNIKRLRIDANGKIGIGVGTDFICYDLNVRLSVNGHIKAKEVVVEMTGWCDDRLDKNFKRMSWIEKEKYISEHQHLPEIPAEKEVKEKGMYTSQVMKGILANTIELYKEIEKLKQEK